MLEHLENVALLWYSHSIDYISSNNVTTADNQQERLRFIGWIVGYTDGEGCFSVSVFKNPTTKSGYQVFPEFVITQGGKSKKSLDIVQRFFKCGRIYVNKRKDNHTENLYRFCVRSLKDLEEKIIPFFLDNPLRTNKSNDFALFVKAVKIISEKKHLTPQGFKQILKIKSHMNRKILRDYMPESHKR